MGNTGSFLCFGEHSMLPCFSLPGIMIYLKIDNWIATDRFAKNGDQIFRNGDQNHLQKQRSELAPKMPFAIFSDQICIF